MSGFGTRALAFCALYSWLHLLLQAFTQQMLSACWVPGTVPGAGNTAVNKTGLGPTLGALKKDLSKLVDASFETRSFIQ